MATLCLVSKSFLVVCRPRLFSTVTLLATFPSSAYPQYRDPSAEDRTTWLTDLRDHNSDAEDCARLVKHCTYSTRVPLNCRFYPTAEDVRFSTKLAMSKGWLPAIASFTNLHVLRLCNCILTITLVHGLIGLSQLRQLEMYGCHALDKLTPELVDACQPKLTSLTTRHCWTRRYGQNSLPTDWELVIVRLTNIPKLRRLGTDEERLLLRIFNPDTVLSSLEALDLTYLCISGRADKPAELVAQWLSHCPALVSFVMPRILSLVPIAAYSFLRSLECSVTAVKSALLARKRWPFSRLIIYDDVKVPTTKALMTRIAKEASGKIVEIVLPMGMFHQIHNNLTLNVPHLTILSTERKVEDRKSFVLALRSCLVSLTFTCHLVFHPNDRFLG